jgi:hypothetical protein
MSTEGTDSHREEAADSGDDQLVNGHRYSLLVND